MQLLLKGSDMPIYDDSYGHWIALVFRGSQTYFINKLTRYKIGRGQHNFLLVLYKKDGISQDKLANILLMNKAAVTRALTKLEKNGYVKRRKNRIDRRNNYIYLTEKAKKLESVMMETVDSWTRILAKELKSEERQQLIKLLRKMGENAVKEIIDEKILSRND